MIRKIIISLCLLVNLVSCTPLTKIPIGIMPSIELFTASPDNIDVGQEVTLKWKVSNANDINIDNKVGKVSGEGSKKVSPQTSIEYTLTASNSSGTTTKSLTVLVYILKRATQPTAGLPEILAFDVSPDIIRKQLNQSSSLHWNVTGATSVHINNLGNVPAIGATTVSPSSTTVYTIFASNATGSVAQSKELTVVP